jgi:rod shape-determining protein MreC
MLNRPYHVAWTVVTLLTVVLLNLPERAAGRTRFAIGALFLPLFGLVGSGQTLTEQGTGALVTRRSLAQEIDRLHQENQQLRLEALQGAEARRENDRLRQLLGWQAQPGWRVRAAKVIARDPENWWRTLLIDRGSRDGLRPNLPVISPEGLVGRVAEVGSSTAQVVFVGDPKCRVAVVVRETGEQGVISAPSAGVLDHRLVDLTHLPRNSALKAGQTVFTSGLGGVFPGGLPVGMVVDSRTVGYGLATEARIKLRADTSRLSEVLVLLP